MTRKHYRALAEALKSSSASLETCKAIGQTCALDNPRFNMDKFLTACGVA